jgi:RNA polymerase sigma-70 factor (ECF subfamily)
MTADERELERFRAELTGYCSRMLGSPADGEDAVQEALVRAWRGLGRLERRARLRTWLYSIATNVCLDMLSRRARRPSAGLVGAAWPPAGLDGPEREAAIEAVAGGSGLAEADPAELAARRETVRQALLASFRHLPPRQRAALLLCEVLGWRAGEAADLLGTSATSVRSALQRARATLAAVDAAEGAGGSLRPRDSDLIARYVAALEGDEVEALASLVREDAAVAIGAAAA